MRREIQIEHDRNVQPAFGGPDVREVGDPTLVRGRRLKLPVQQIRAQSRSLVARPDPTATGVACGAPAGPRPASGVPRDGDHTRNPRLAGHATRGGCRTSGRCARSSCGPESTACRSPALGGSAAASPNCPITARSVDLGNTICPVLGGKVDKNVSVVYNGTRVHFCCADCIKTFTADPEKYLTIAREKMEKAAPAQPAAPAEEEADDGAAG